MILSTIADNVERVRQRIRAACARVGRSEAEVKLVAVSKFQPLEAIRAAASVGLRDFGENYVQELERKCVGLMGTDELKEIRWHLIGHLQSNKLRRVFPLVHQFHALDSKKMADAIHSLWKASGMAQRWQAYIQVNLDQEATKGGVAPNQLEALVTHVRKLSGIHLLGLMTIPNPNLTGTALRSHYQRMQLLNAGLGLTQLSMGMSDDFEIAIEEGATSIRVGRAIFGDRPIQK